MSNPVPAAKPSADGKPAANPAAVIRRIQGAEESAQQRLLKKHIPAWVISGAVHVLLIGGLIVLDKLMPPPAVAAQSEEMLAVVTDEKAADEKPQDLTNPDVGLEPELPAAVEVDNLADVNVMKDVVPDQPPGIENTDATKPVDINPPAGVGTPDAMAPGLTGDTGMFAAGMGGGGNGASANDGFLGRSGASKERMLRSGGGNGETEAAVARGLIWLAKQQKKDSGRWDFEGGSSKDAYAASTGMALLPFLAAGQTHKPFKENKYQKTVADGLNYLVNIQNPNGSFKFLGGQPMYAQGIATVALCEAYGMTGDKKLLGPVQRAVSFIVSAQAADGSWGYNPGEPGDTSIVGWAIQALHSAKLCKDVVVPKATFEKARQFLDKVADSAKKATYGYRDKNSARPTLTAVGLLCRYYVDGWGPNNQSMAAGVKYLLDHQQPDRNKFEMYYTYYATQVVHFFDGPEWHKIWNPKMQRMLLDLQVPADKKDGGSWNPDGPWIGTHCGRLGTTCLCLLSLEVYYRHLPLYKRDAAGMRELERAR